MQLTSLPPCGALKQHFALSHAVLAQTIHLQRIPCPSEAWQSQLIALVERKTSGGLFVSPCTNPEPYREFHYYCDERNTLWALMVVDVEDNMKEVYLHPHLYADPEVFAICTFFTTEDNA